MADAGTLSASCHEVCSLEARSTKSLNPLFPNLESPCSSGGLRRTTSSTLSRILSMVLSAGLRSLSLTAETGVSMTESVRPKTKAKSKSYVFDARNNSWSFGESIRLVGLWNMSVDSSGGEGNVGVSGTGRGFDGGACRRRGSSLGKRFRRSGIEAGSGSLEIVLLSVLEGILLYVVQVVR